MPKAPESKNIPKGWTCKCGTFHPFALWVYAHWDEKITGSCNNCGHVQPLQRGRKVKS